MSFRHETSFGEVLQMLDGGWFPAWASVENDKELYIDWCVLWRMNDGKIRFTETFDITPEQVSRFKELAAIAWKQEAEEFPRHLGE